MKKTKLFVECLATASAAACPFPCSQSFNESADMPLTFVSACLIHSPIGITLHRTSGTTEVEVVKHSSDGVQIKETRVKEEVKDRMPANGAAVWVKWHHYHLLDNWQLAQIKAKQWTKSG